ncbi:hypothetical protein QBK99_25790 [Corticibacterium sp. UT-5YL-CI-8]|nr:hypothetical protein [Tianweitania sp. UT-5YL-CI-8]
MEFDFAAFNGGSFLPATGNASYGTFHVRDSVFNGTDGFYIWYPGDGSGFWNTAFWDTSGLSIGTTDSFELRENAFYNATGIYGSDAAVHIWAAYGPDVLLRGNTFSGSPLAIEVANSAGVDARGNFWGTLDPSRIRQSIFDANDDLNLGSVVDVRNPLAEFSPNAPAMPLTVHGTRSGETLAGNRYDDKIFGYGGEDLLKGGDGGDILNGSSGIDTMIGGGGNDIYYVDHVGDNVVEAAGEGTDRVISTVSFSLQGRYVETLDLTGTKNIDATGNKLANVLDGNNVHNVLSV